MSGERRTALISAILAAFLFGGCAPFAKLLLEDIQPMILSSLLYLGSGAGLVLFMAVHRVSGGNRKNLEAAIKREDLPWLAGLTIFGGILAPVVLMYSLSYTPAATATLLLNFEAVATTVIAGLFFKEAVGKKILFALSLITLSCILLTFDPGSGLGFSIAAFGIILSCVFWALDNNMSRNISSCDPIPVVAIKGLLAGTVTFFLAILVGDTIPALSLSAVAMVFGFFSYGGMTSVLFLIALRGIGTSRTGSLLAISPFFGVIIAFLLFMEPPDPAFYIALPVMAAGALLLIFEKHSHPHHHHAQRHEHRHRHDDLHHDHGHLETDPPVSSSGEHSHMHDHPEIHHDHPHTPDIHHRHRH